MTKFTKAVVLEIQELQKLGIVRANGQCEYAIANADDNKGMSVSECADLMIELSAIGSDY